MRRFPWVSVALLIVLGLFAFLTYPTWGTTLDKRHALASQFAMWYVVVGWACVGLALVIGALGVWARAPATLPTALGIIGSGLFAGAWLMEALKRGDEASLRLGSVVAFTATMVAFAASARRVPLAEANP
jgi:hypothetical protein